MSHRIGPHKQTVPNKANNPITWTKSRHEVQTGVTSVLGQLESGACKRWCGERPGIHASSFQTRLIEVKLSWKQWKIGLISVEAIARCRYRQSRSGHRRIERRTLCGEVEGISHLASPGQGDQSDDICTRSRRV